MSDKELGPEVAEAERLMLMRQLVVSGNRYQPKLVWTRAPWSRDDLRRAVEAERASPFRVLEMQALERGVIFWAGAPYWAQYAYLILVEVKAINV